MADTALMDKLVSLCKRRGFVFQSSEIYGGLGTVWDYGPLGVQLKKNVKDRWWRAMVHARKGSMQRFSCTRRCGRHPGTSRASPTPWSTAGTARTGSAPTIHGSRAPPASPMRSARCAAARGRSPSPGCSTSCSRPSWAGRRAGGGGATAAGDGAGHSMLTCRARGSASPAQIGKAFRNEITPELLFPDARVRTHGNAVLREARELPTANGSSGGGNGGCSGTTISG